VELNAVVAEEPVVIENLLDVLLVFSITSGLVYTYRYDRLSNHCEVVVLI
jgi:hypothetical protein